jgi:hypothetical protein
MGVPRHVHARFQEAAPILQANGSSSDPADGVFFYVRFPEGDRRFNPWIAPRYGATPSGALFGHHGDVGGSACRMMHQVFQADEPPK